VLLSNALIVPTSPQYIRPADARSTVPTPSV